MAECRHKNVEDVTCFEDHERVFLCLDCGAQVSEPQEPEGEEDEGLPMQEETGQAILFALNEIRDLLLKLTVEEA